MPRVETGAAQEAKQIFGDGGRAREILKLARLVGDPLPWNTAALAQHGQRLDHVLIRAARAGALLGDDLAGDQLIVEEPRGCRQRAGGRVLLEQLG